MIVRQFISWVRNASAGERAEATRSLARAWLISDLSEDDRAAAEGALLMLLDDPSPLVRQAMAEVFSRSTDAPAAIVQAVYPGLDPELTGAASESVQAHLDKLEHDGHLERRAGEWWHLDAGR